MEDQVARANARRGQLAHEARELAQRIREREAEVALSMVEDGRTGVDVELTDLRGQRWEVLEELRLLDVGVELARQTHH